MPVICALICRSIRRHISWRTWSNCDSTWVWTDGCSLAVRGAHVCRATPATRHCNGPRRRHDHPASRDRLALSGRGTPVPGAVGPLPRGCPPGGTRWRSRLGVPPPAARSRSGHAHAGGTGVARARRAHGMASRRSVVTRSPGVGAQRGGHHPAVVAFFRQRAVEPVTTGAGFVDQHQMCGLGLPLADA